MERIVQEYFRDESLLSTSLGCDGMLGFFASNYPAIMEITRTVVRQNEESRVLADQAAEDLQDAHDKLEEWKEDYGDEMDDDLDQHAKDERKIIDQNIKNAKSVLKSKRPVRYRGKVLKFCPEVEFIIKVDGEFPGLLEAMTEFDRLIRIPIAKLTSKGLGWALTPLKLVVGTIVDRADLGHAGTLIWMLVDGYPELIRRRMEARPADEAITDEQMADDQFMYETTGYETASVKKEVKTYSPD